MDETGEAPAPRGAPLRGGRPAAGRAALGARRAHARRPRRRRRGGRGGGKRGAAVRAARRRARRRGRRRRRRRGRALGVVAGIIREITGARAEGGDQLISLGVDSLNLLALSQRLKQAFGVGGLDLFLVQNPTVAEICERVAAPAAAGGAAPGDDAKYMHMDAVFGLRSLLCFWIMRHHLEVVVCGEMQNEVSWTDERMVWRTNIFIFLNGMQMAMQYDKRTVSRAQLIKGFVPFLPAYYLVLFFVLPVGYFCNSHDGYMQYSLFSALLLLQSPLITIFVMGHAGR